MVIGWWAVLKCVLTLLQALYIVMKAVALAAAAGDTAANLAANSRQCCDSTAIDRSNHWLKKLRRG